MGFGGGIAEGAGKDFGGGIAEGAGKGCITAGNSQWSATKFINHVRSLVPWKKLPNVPIIKLVALNHFQMNKFRTNMTNF